MNARCVERRHLSFLARTAQLALFLAALSSAACWAADPDTIDVVARDPGGHGLLCERQGKAILLVEGTPREMGAAHGRLLGRPAKKLVQRVLYLVGGAESIQSGTWFLDRVAEIERRTLPHVPERFLEECDALAEAAGVSRRDGRYAMASNPSTDGIRNPLCLSLSDDGVVFTRMAVLRDAPTVYRYAGKDPGYAGYHYPHLLEHGDHLYVIHAENMEDIVLLRVPIVELNRIRAATD